MKVKMWLFMLLVSLFTGQLQAKGFKCNKGFVSVGDRKVTVMIRCGEPFFSEVISGDDDIKTEEWTYKSSAYKGFLRVLRFRGGRLVDISVGEKIN